MCIYCGGGVCVFIVLLVMEEFVFIIVVVAIETVFIVAVVDVCLFCCGSVFLLWWCCW